MRLLSLSWILHLGAKPCLTSVRPIVHKATSHGHLSAQSRAHAELLRGPILPLQMNCASCNYAHMVVKR